MRAVASSSECGKGPGSRSWSLHGKDVPKVVGKQIATGAIELSHKIKVSDNVKVACVGGAAELRVHALPQPSQDGLRR
jgi:hypothetical protein